MIYALVLQQLLVVATFRQIAGRGLQPPEIRDKTPRRSILPGNELRVEEEAMIPVAERTESIGSVP